MLVDFMVIKNFSYITTNYFTEPENWVSFSYFEY